MLDEAIAIMFADARILQPASILLQGRRSAPARDLAINVSIKRIACYFTAPGITSFSGDFCCSSSSGCGSGLRGNIWSRMAVL